MSNKTPYFPFFMNILNAKGMIIGGGKQAYEKICRMYPFGPKLTVIASEFIPEIEKIEGIHLIKRVFQMSDLEQEPDFVIVTDGEEELKRLIFEYCKERRIPVNTVDEEAYSSYIYSAMIARGSLTVGISTAGVSPTAAVLIKEEISEWLPEQIEEILDWLEDVRPSIKKKVSDKEQCRIVLRKITKAAMKKGMTLTEAEVDQIINLDRAECQS